jgi:signal transduction histidine kinase/ligand-binding sensor domain-containing protein
MHLSVSPDPIASTTSMVRWAPGAVRFLVCASLGVSVIAITAQGTRAQMRPRAFTELAHTAWTTRDGAPGAVRGLAQGADGVLWIASERGLYQFDGIRFERFEPPSGQALRPHGAHVLLALPDTSLWIGHFTSGVSVLHRGRIVTYDTTQGLPDGTVTAIARDSNGTMWASTTRGLARLNVHRWEVMDSTAGYPAGFTEPVLVDRRGSVWALSRNGIYVLPRGAKHFERHEMAGLGSRVHWLASAPDGSIWGAQRPVGLFEVADARGDPPRDQTVAYTDTLPFSVTFIPGHPAVLNSTTGRLVSIRIPGVTDTLASARGQPIAAEMPFSRSAGMSGDRVAVSLYDREGTLWVGTPTGIDRFRETKLTPVTWPGQVNWPAVAADTNGAVWVAARNAMPSTLFVIGDGVHPRPIGQSTLTSIYRDLHGGLWLGGEPGLWERKGDAFVPVPLPTGSPTESSLSQAVHAIARDRNDQLWVSIVNRGVYRRRAGIWTRFEASPEASQAVATVITADGAGRIWLGYTSGRVVLVERDSLNVFTPAESLGVGSVLAISVFGDRVWIAGQLGLAALALSEAQRGPWPFSRILTAGDSPLGVSGVVETADGDLWLNGADGVTRITASEVRRALADPRYRVSFERLDYRDGIDPPAPPIRPLPSAIVGTDGRLWFTSAGGVSWLNPREVRRNAVPPPVQLRSLMVGDDRRVVHHATEDTIRVPPGTTGLSIAYTAYSLAIPERVRFKHRLEGLDTTWHDVGGRREAFYTNLRPGHYRFRVIAANDDGVWNEDGVQLRFDVLPAWYQTAWFRAAVVLMIGALGAAAALVVQRGRHLRVQLALTGRYEATLAERARIAQDLHDTLLQGFAGVTLQLKTAELALPERPDVAAETILRVQQLARASLKEARERVWDMRDAEFGRADLPEALEATLREYSTGTGIEIAVITTGQRRRLERSIEDAAFRIGREAAANAVRHAQARRVEIHIDFGATNLRLDVVDDGRGFTPGEADDARRRGHFGMSGMRERATRMGGACDVKPRAGGGTIITIDLPVSATRA